MDNTARERDINRVRLAEFFRNRRERLQPHDLGLPNAKRRRKPGLRREDVAELAGISATYYTWIEQARDLRLSRDVIGDLATALRLNQAERKYIVTLAGLELAEGLSVEDEQRLHPTLAHIVGDESAMCAVLCDPWFNAVAASPLARRVLLVTPQSWPEQNLIWRLCHDPAYASIWRDWQSELRLSVGMFRLSLAKDPYSIAGNRILEKLSVHAFFANLWMTCDVQLNPSPEEYFREAPWELSHPGVGHLRVHRIGICPPTRKPWVLTIFSPSDAETRRKFSHLALNATASNQDNDEALAIVDAAAGRNRQC
jgi:transcriptional regulator with XRE-family HTH domain